MIVITIIIISSVIMLFSAQLEESFWSSRAFPTRGGGCQRPSGREVQGLGFRL